MGPGRGQTLFPKRSGLFSSHNLRVAFRSSTTCSSNVAFDMFVSPPCLISIKFYTVVFCETNKLLKMCDVVVTPQFCMSSRGRVNSAASARPRAGSSYLLLHRFTQIRIYRRIPSWEMIGNCFFPSGSQSSKNKENCKFFYFISPIEHQRKEKMKRTGWNYRSIIRECRDSGDTILNFVNFHSSFVTPSDPWAGSDLQSEPLIFPWR